MDAYADALGVSAPAPKARSAGTTPALMEGRSDLLKTLEGLKSTLADAKEGSALYQRTMTDIGNLNTELGKMPGGAPAAAPAAAPAPVAAKADPYGDALGIGRPEQPITASKPAPAPAPGMVPKPDISAAPAQIRSVLGNQVTGIGANIVGGWRGLSTLLTGGTLDDAANNVRGYVDSHTYTPDAGTAGAQGVESFNSPTNPLSYIPQAADYAGGRLTDLTGSPALGAAANTAINAAPMLLGFRGKPGTAPVDVGPSRPGTGVYTTLERPSAVTLPFPGEPAPVVPQQMPQQGAPVGAPIPAAPRPAAPVAAPAPPVPATAAAVQAVAEKAPAALFPETPTSSPQGKFGPAEQTERARILRSVGIEETRNSAIAGDGTAGGTDFQTSKLDSVAGRKMKSILDGERQALVTHAEGLIEQTGGSHGVDSPALYNRGETILAPLDKLRGYYDGKAKSLYDAANERAQGRPVSLGSFRQVLEDGSEMTSPDRLTFRDAAKAFAKKNGMLQEDGSIAGDALQAETLRKWLNKNRNHSNGSYVDGLKESLDNDVLSTAGEDLYTQARSMWQEKKATLDNPDGIARLLQEEGINRAIPKEMIAPKIVRMPVDQFGHIVNTLKGVPEEIQPAAQSALNEIKAQFANELHATGSSQAGQWNAKGVTKYLQTNAARMAQVFTPEEIQAFRNLNDAGHIVAKDQSYPGAAVQGHNLLTTGVMHGLTTAGAAAGGFIGGPVGAAVGGAAGRMAGGAVESAATMRAVKKRTTKLSDLLGTGK